MHILVGVLAAIAAVIFYTSRISRGAADLVDAANELGNLPRRLRYRKKAGKTGLDLVETPTEAATILLISIARMEKFCRVSDDQAHAMIRILSEQMHVDKDYADDLVVHMRALSHHLNQPESTLFPMIKILQSAINRQEAQELSMMMAEMAAFDTPANDRQIDFIRRFKDRMGLLG